MKDQIDILFWTLTFLALLFGFVLACKVLG